MISPKIRRATNLVVYRIAIFYVFSIFFIVALVPPFIDASAPQLPQYLLIAATLCATDIVVMSGYALAAARLGRWLHDPQALRMQNRFFGGLFVFAGAVLALSSRQH